MLPYFLENAVFVEVANVEVLRTPLRTDRVYKILYWDRPAILDLEFESGSDAKIAIRLSNYHTYYLEKFDRPVVTVVVYLFPTSEAESPYQEECGPEKLMTFYFHTLCLWKLDAKYFVQKHVISMYAFLPTMNGANEEVLLDALNELSESYVGDNVQLANQLKWLGVLLRRSETMSIEDKVAVQERLNMWDNLLDQDPYLQKKIATSSKKAVEKAVEEAVEKATEKALDQGELNASRSMVLDIIDERFPTLTEMAKRRVQKIQAPADLRQLARKIVVATR